MSPSRSCMAPLFVMAPGATLPAGTPRSRRSPERRQSKPTSLQRVLRMAVLSWTKSSRIRVYWKQAQTSTCTACEGRQKSDAHVLYPYPQSEQIIGWRPGRFPKLERAPSPVLPKTSAFFVLQQAHPSEEDLAKRTADIKKSGSLIPRVSLNGAQAVPSNY